MRWAPAVSIWSAALGRRLRWCGRRDHEGQPRAVTLRPVLDGEVPVGPQVEITLIFFAQREEKSDLRTDAEHASLEIAELCAGAAVAGELLEDVARDAGMNGLA